MNEIESRVLEANAAYLGISRMQMMENAGRETARFVEENFPKAKHVGIFCGLGNNGGDGFCAARFLLTAKKEITVILVGSPKSIATLEARENWRAIEPLQPIRKILISDSKEFDACWMELKKFEVVLDCILGTGQSGELREPVRSAVGKINSLTPKAAIIAVDVPTGFGTRTQVKAGHTVSFHYPKTPRATALSIGIPEQFEELVGPGHVQALSFSDSNPKSHKGQNGVLLVVGGGREYHGAPISAVKAASKIVDLVYFAGTPANNELVKKMKIECADFMALEWAGITETLKRADCTLVGPGMDIDANAKSIVNSLLKAVSKSNGKKKIVLDASALRMADKRLLSPAVCVTPHAGEFEALFGIEATGENAREMAKRHDCAILLKDKGNSGFDWIAESGGGKLVKNSNGNEGMTKGGTGDVLAGLTAAFACKNGLFHSACAAAFVNGLAGDLLKERAGVNYSASDLAQELPRAIKLAREF
ncbi:NAD(P)H-hydrate dehydratase [Candidatus Micrarchaeota archaeon]|nr:NAD(P)H-hydrate dehydratase [Candidatus Micrarchaeota archaeon]